MSELKPCPFCGKPDPALDGKSNDVRVRCEGCGALGQIAFFEDDDDDGIVLSEATAIATWNRRAAPDEASRAPAPISDERIIEIAIATKSAEPGRDGYVLPITFARAVLAQSQGGRPATSREQGDDAARLDWLDKRGEAYGFEDTHEGNYWSINGAYATIRRAIDCEMDAELRKGAAHGITPATEGAKP